MQIEPIKIAKMSLYATVDSLTADMAHKKSLEKKKKKKKKEEF